MIGDGSDALAVDDLLVIWDLDGTLCRLLISLDDIRGWKRELRRELAARGWEGSLSPLLPNLEAALDSIGAEMVPEEARSYRAEIYDRLDRWEAEALQGIEPIRDNLERLAQQVTAGVTVALVTNNGPRAAERASREVALPGVDDATLREVFIAWLPRGPQRAAKPAPDAFHAAVESYASLRGRPPRGVVVIGDSSSDAGAAAATRYATGLPVAFVETNAGDWRPQVEPDAPESRLLDALP